MHFWNKTIFAEININCDFGVKKNYDSQLSKYDISFEPSESKFEGTAILVKNNIDMIDTRVDLKLQNNAQTLIVWKTYG